MQGDLISREALMIELKDYLLEVNEKGHIATEQAIHECIEKVLNQPSKNDIENIIADMELWSYNTPNGKAISTNIATEIIRRGGLNGKN